MNPSFPKTNGASFDLHHANGCVRSGSQIIVSELDHARIAELHSQGYRVLDVAEGFFSEDGCKIDGFLMVKRA